MEAMDMKSRRKARFAPGVTVPEDELGCAEIVYRITWAPIRQWSYPGKSVEIMLEVLSTLSDSEDEYHAVAMRYGIGTDEPWKSPREIGLLWGISTGRVQRVIEKAFRRLRHPKRKDLILPLIGIVADEEPLKTPSKPIDYSQRPLLFEPAEKFLDRRGRMALERSGKDIRFVGELITLGEEDFLKIPGVGKKALEYTRDRLASIGLCLGFRLEKEFHDLCAKRKAEAAK
jgi:hypothetical protein